MQKNILRETIELYISSLKKRCLEKVKEENITPNKQDQKRKCSWHIKIKILSFQKNERIFKASRGEKAKKYLRQTYKNCI